VNGDKAAVFPNLAALVPEGEQGVAKVVHLHLAGEVARQASYVAGEYIPTPPGSYALLMVQEADGQTRCMMSDLSYERSTCEEFVQRAHGRVLIAGLGLGMVLHPVLAKLVVTSVTVIEKYPDVIDLIYPTLPVNSKLQIYQADIFDWTPPANVRYDVIWFDIWPDIDVARLNEMAVLHQRFRPFLDRQNPDGWMESWHRRETESIATAQARQQTNNLAADPSLS
jgi:hypothetical protein